MKIDLLIENIEMNFETLTGFSFHGLVGIIVGLIVFSLLLFLFYHRSFQNLVYDFIEKSDQDEMCGLIALLPCFFRIEKYLYLIDEI